MVKNPTSLDVYYHSRLVGVVFDQSMAFEKRNQPERIESAGSFGLI